MSNVTPHSQAEYLRQKSADAWSEFYKSVLRNSGQDAIAWRLEQAKHLDKELKLAKRGNR